MILPVIINDGQGPPFADTLTKRLAALSELVLQVPDGSAGPGAEVIARYKTFLGEFGCRVGPFDVLSEDRDAKVKSLLAHDAASAWARMPVPCGREHYTHRILCKIQQRVITHVTAILAVVGDAVFILQRTLYVQTATAVRRIRLSAHPLSVDAPAHPL